MQSSQYDLLLIATQGPLSKPGKLNAALNPQ
jgi:hypothetical protein